MHKRILVLLLVILVSITACEQGEEDMITGEVIEIPPAEDIFIEIDDEVLISEQDYSHILVRVKKVEGDMIELKPDAYDPDGDTIIYTFTEPFDEDGEWKTEEGDAGEYLVTVTASDGKLSTSEDVLVIVKQTNRAPVIDCPEELSLKEGDLVELGCEIFDPEEAELEISITGWMNTTEYQTTYEDAGEYEVTITASDGEKTKGKTIAITVDDFNRVPVVTLIKEITVEETETVLLEVEATDADGDDLTFAYGEPFNDKGEWETNYGDTGTYESHVTVSDGIGMTRVGFTVVVTQKNTAPSLEFIESITVDEGDTITLPINAFDREGDELTVTVSGWFDTETYLTTFEDAGEYTVNVTVSDDELSTTQTVDIVVNDMNRPPVFKILA